MLNFGGRKHLFVFVLLSYIVVVAILKCLDVSKPSHRSNDNSEGMAKNLTGSRCHRLQQQEGSLLLTLFTTFRDSPDRRTIHRNTIDNWSKLRSCSVQPLLYVVNDTDWSIVDAARRSGWIVRLYNISTPSRPTTASRAPVLRHMFVDAERTSRSLFYGYSNGDILFDEALPTTLLEIFDDDVVGRYNELLITGVRTDCVVDADPQCGVSFKSAGPTVHSQLQSTSDDYNSKEGKSRTLSKDSSDMSSENVRWLTETTASFPRHMHTASGPTTTTLKNAQDYFITKRSGFSWSTIPDFVVGRAGVDNWLMVTALARRAAVVDASRTVTARHQVRSGHEPSAHFTQPTGDATVNYALAGRSFDYSLGLTDCAPLETVPAEEPTRTASVRQHSNDCAERRTVVVRRRTMNRYCQRADVKLRGLHRLSRGAGNSHRSIN